MATLAHHFQEGGSAMYGILCCALFGNPVAFAALIVALVGKRRPAVIGTGAASLVFGVLTMGLGVAGYLYGMSVVDSVIPLVDVESRDMIYERGREESMNNIYFGVIAALFPLAIGGLAILRGVMLPARDPQAA
ncbi:MAG: hypothetical protein H6719_15240 [Sandaracinaceae bacterium]|nr:hypothetical protein [Sandaracinaceae bacterium]